MKKLMTMLAAVATAFGLYAGTDAQGFLSGTGFESTKAGVTDEIFAAGATTVSGDFWSGELSKASLITGTYTFDAQNIGVPEQFKEQASARYLKIATAVNTEEVTRKYATDGTGLNISKAVYFDSLVNFTVFDYNDTVTVPNDAKLGVYLMLNEAETETNLYVYAQNGDTAQAYKTTLKVAEGWHRLTIKAIGNVYNTGDAVGFAVFVDQNPVGCTAAILADTSDLTLYAAGLNKYGELFLSLDQSTTQNAKKIFSVSYSGQGEVDDLAFTTQYPFENAKDMETFTATWTAIKDNINALTIGTKVLTAAEIAAGLIELELPADGTVDMIWTGKDTFINGKKTITGLVDGDASKAVLTSDDVKQAAAVVDGLKLALLSDAVATANVATVDCELKLLADATAQVEFGNASAKITIDLNSHALQAFTVNSGDVIVDDSAEGGKIDGEVFVDEEYATLLFNAGKVKYTGNESLLDFTTISVKDGYKFEKQDDYWVLVEKTGMIISVACVGHVTSVDNQDGSYTFTAAEGYTIASAFGNGAPIDGLVLGGTTLTISNDDVAGDTAVIVSADKTVTAAEKTWFADGKDNLGAVEVTELTDPAGERGCYHPASDGDFFGFCFGNGGTKGAILFDAYGSKTLSVDTPTNNAMRGMAISKKLNLAIFGNYWNEKYVAEPETAGTDDMYAAPLNADAWTTDNVKAIKIFAADGETEITKTFALDHVAFAADGKTLFGIMINSSDYLESAGWLGQFSVATNGDLTLVKAQAQDSRMRTFTAAKVGGRQYVFGALESGKIAAIDVSGDTWTSTDIANDVTKDYVKYGDLVVNGNILTVAVSANSTAGADFSNECVTVYELTVNGDVISATEKASFTWADLYAAGFPKRQKHNVAVRGTDDGKTMYFGYVQDAATTNSVLVKCEWTEWFNVGFDGNGQTIDIAAQRVMKNGKVTEPTAPEVEGKVFKGWFKEQACENEWNFDTDTVTAATTLYAKWEDAGPVVNPEDAEKGSIEVEGTTATVTLKGDATEIRIEGGLGLTEVDVPVQLKKIRGVNASAIKVKVGADDITAAFTKTGDGSTGYVELALNPAGEVTIGQETIKVTPTIGENVEASEVKITDGEIAVQAIPGLTYTLNRSAEVGGTVTAVDSEKADSTKVSLVDETTKPVDKAFYQITVEAK